MLSLWQAVKNKIEALEQKIKTDVAGVAWTDLTEIFKDIVAVIEAQPTVPPVVPTPEQPKT